MKAPRRLSSSTDHARRELRISAEVALFRQLGFIRVSVTGHKDKSLEFGKDLWMKFQLPTEHFIYFGSQVKREKIDASAGGKNENVATVLDQVRMMLAHPIFDPETNSKHLLDHVYIISAGEITKAARSLLAERLDQEARRHIIFMDRDDILNLAVETNLRVPGEEQATPQDAGEIPF